MTAVEWLHNTWGNYPDLCTWEKIQEWFEQAKEMEEIQIIDTIFLARQFDSGWEYSEDEIIQSLKQSKQ